MGTGSSLETQNPCSGISMRTLPSLPPHAYPRHYISRLTLSNLHSSLWSHSSRVFPLKKQPVKQHILVTVLGNQILRLPPISVQSVCPDSQVEDF